MHSDANAVRKKKKKDLRDITYNVILIIPVDYHHIITQFPKIPKVCEAC